MSSSDFLTQAAIYMAAAVIAVPICKKLGLGSVLGYLLAGIVIGPHVLQLIPDPEQVLHFAEFGVMLLLFLVGLELNPQKAWQLRKTLFGLGGLQVVITTLLVMGLAHLIGLSWTIAIVIGMGVAMSSTAIGLTTLIEKKQLQTPSGQASFAILLFQDISVVPLFILLALMAPQAASEGSFSGLAVLKAIGVIGLIILTSRTILRPIMRIMAQTQMREMFLAFSLLLVVGVSIAVQQVGLSMALGTFLAGVLLADSEYHHQLRIDIEPVKGLLLGLFFIAVGMSVDLTLIASHPLWIIGLACTLVVLKISILAGLGRLMKLAWRDALLMAIALSQIGEFAFVIFGLALAQGSIGRDIYDQLNAIVVISMLLTPLLFVLYDRVANRELVSTQERDVIEESNTVIIAGLGRFGQMVARILLARGMSATLIDRDPNQVKLMREFGWRCYYGDASRMDLLEEAGITHARLFVIAVDDVEDALDMAKLVQLHWKHVHIVVRARSRTDAYEFRELDLSPIRETFHSALHAAHQALVMLGETPKMAQKIVNNFEAHDIEQFEKAFKVRKGTDSKQALMDIVTEGRENLKSLLTAESLLDDERQS